MLQVSHIYHEAVALVVRVRSDEQIMEGCDSMQAKIPAAVWTELRREQLIERDAVLPTPPGQ